MQYPVYKDIYALVLEQIDERKEFAFAFLAYIVMQMWDIGNKKLWTSWLSIHLQYLQKDSVLYYLPNFQSVIASKFQAPVKYLMWSCRFHLIDYWEQISKDLPLFNNFDINLVWNVFNLWGETAYAKP